MRCDVMGTIAYRPVGQQRSRNRNWILIDREASRPEASRPPYQQGANRFTFFAQPLYFHSLQLMGGPGLGLLEASNA